MGNFSIAPTIKVGRSHSQSAEHAADLLTVFGRMVNDLSHDNPGFNEETIRRLELRFQVFAGLVSRQSQQPFSTDIRNLLQLGVCRGTLMPRFNWQGQE
jgi:hypothetical protein